MSFAFSSPAPKSEQKTPPSNPALLMFPSEALVNSNRSDIQVLFSSRNMSCVDGGEGEG
jgi:hypothetical protein